MKWATIQVPRVLGFKVSFHANLLKIIPSNLAKTFINAIVWIISMPKNVYSHVLGL